MRKSETAADLQTQLTHKLNRIECKYQIKWRYNSSACQMNFFDLKKKKEKKELSDL